MKLLNHQQVFKGLYFKKVQQLLDTKKSRGDKVGLAIQKDKFEKPYIINWTIHNKIKNINPFTYIFQDEYRKNIGKHSMNRN